MKAARLLLYVCAGTVITSAMAVAQQDSPPKEIGAPKDSAPSGMSPKETPPADAGTADASAEGETANFVLHIKNIVAPVTVLDRNGALVDGIEGGRFHLYDNGKQQNIAVDITVQPISMVIAIQQSDRVDAVLSQIHRIGPMIQPLVTGDNGEAAVISFDSRIQDKTLGFTSDGDRIQKAIQSIHSGNSPSRMIDAVEQGVQMLKGRNPTRRRIILLISETRDVSSEARLRETLIAAQLANVTVYTLDISRIVTNLTAKPIPPGVDPMPPAAYNLSGIRGVDTPTSVQQAFHPGDRVEFLPMLKEIYLGTKRIFVENPAEIFTEGTGGAQFTFKRERGLEDAIAAVAREIHSQYLITYAPTTLTEDGFHQIRVDIDMPGLVVRTRPGYYLAGVGAK